PQARQPFLSSATSGTPPLHPSPVRLHIPLPHSYQHRHKQHISIRLIITTITCHPIVNFFSLTLYPTTNSAPNCCNNLSAPTSTFTIVTSVIRAVSHTQKAPSH